MSFKSQPGEAHPRARLTDDKVRTIRRLSKAGMTGTMIARQFGVTRQAISKVLRRAAWAHVRDEENP